MCDQSPPRFEEVDHTADIAIQVWGRDLAELFANAAYGMAHQLTDVGEITPEVEERIELEAYDVETLLVTWLGELLFRLERDGRVFADFEMLETTQRSLRAIARGGPMGERRYSIKAVTFSDLEIVQTGCGYQTTVVFDV